MRIVVLTFAGLAFAAGLIIEPSALFEIARICLGGHCGVRPRWIWLCIAGIATMVVVALAWPKRPPPPPPKAARKPRAKSGAMPARNAPPKSRRVEKP